MFDDPKKELRRLEQELLAAEYEEEPEEQEEEFGSGFAFEEDDWLQEAKTLIGEEEEIPIRNHANGYGTRPRNYAVDFDRTVYDDEEMDEDKAVFVDEPKPKGIGGLVLLALLEVLGIVAIVWWWIQWLA